jgi:hypothetical protein
MLRQWTKATTERHTKELLIEKIFIKLTKGLCHKQFESAILRQKKNYGKLTIFHHAKI